MPGLSIFKELGRGCTLYQISLNEAEQNGLESLLQNLSQRYSSVEDKDFLENSRLYSHELPLRLKKTIDRYAYREDGAGYCRISGYPLDMATLTPTPNDWANRVEPSPTIREEMFLVLCSCLLGDPIAWATQQNGYLVHDIMPMKKYEHEQLGFSSKELLTWHVEDAFHDYRGDYLGMMCLRNPTATATLFASIADIELSERDLALLAKPVYTIRPDESHKAKNKVDGLAQADIEAGDLTSSYDFIEQLSTKPDPIPVLFGDLRDPYLRVDPFFMEEPDDTECAAALDRLVHAIEDKMQHLVLQPGETLFVDNFRAVHGRLPFEAKYDGSDRWLKRVNVARDLRKSRARRRNAIDRRIL